jgi:hypothetical protein
VKEPSWVDRMWPFPLLKAGEVASPSTTDCEPGVENKIIVVYRNFSGIGDTPEQALKELQAVINRHNSVYRSLSSNWVDQPDPLQCRYYRVGNEVTVQWVDVPKVTTERQLVVNESVAS